MPIFTYAFHSKRRPTHATTTTDDEGYGNEQQLHILVEDYIRDEEKQEETYALLQTMVGLMTNGDNETKKGVARQLIEKGWYKQISKSQAP